MKIELILLGKTRENYLREGIEDYSQRLRRFTALDLVYVKIGRNTKKSEMEIIREESRLLNDNIGTGSFRLVLDSSGRQFTSEQLAMQLSSLEQKGVKTMSCIIGGHLGLAPEQVAAADQVLSLSKLTFTHDMSRLLLLEQLYRAYSIKAGTRYHK